MIHRVPSVEFPGTTAFAALDILECASPAILRLGMNICNRIIRSNKGDEGQYVTVARPLGSKRTAAKAEYFSVSDWKARLKRD